MCFYMFLYKKWFVRYPFFGRIYIYTFRIERYIYKDIFIEAEKMGIFDYFRRRKIKAMVRDIGKASDLERSQDLQLRRIRQLKRETDRDRRQALLDELEELRIQKQIQEIRAEFDEEEDDFDPIDAAENPDAMLIKLFTQIVSKSSIPPQGNATGSTPISPAPVATPRYSADAIRSFKSTLSKDQLKALDQANDEDIIPQIQKFMPGASDGEIRTALTILRE